MSSTLISVAWVGWHTHMPAEWRPLRITGGWSKGELVLGNAHTSLARLGWQRPPAGRFDATSWLAGRQKEAFDPADGAAPPELEHPDFSEAIHCTRLPPPRAKEVGRTVWCGYAPRSNLIVECRVGNDIASAAYRTLVQTLLRSLRAVALDEPIPWAVFDASFQSPAGYIFEASHLYAGDIGLRFKADAGRRLTLRQLYPADLALSRHSLETWLDHPLFTNRLVFKPNGVGESRMFCMPDGRLLPGILRTGRRVLRRPFSAIARRHVVQVVVHDTARKRLLLVDAEGLHPVTLQTCENAVRGMGTCRETH